MPKASKHADFLRELGFEPMSPEDEAYIKDRTSRRLSQMDFEKRVSNLNRRQRRQMQKMLEKPTFGIHSGIEPSVHVKDETGNHWVARKVIDTSLLLKCGFEDVTYELALTAAASLPPPPPRKTN